MRFFVFNSRYFTTNFPQLLLNLLLFRCKAEFLDNYGVKKSQQRTHAEQLFQVIPGLHSAWNSRNLQPDIGFSLVEKGKKTKCAETSIKTKKNSGIKTKMMGSALLVKLGKNSRQLQSGKAPCEFFFFFSAEVRKI